MHSDGHALGPGAIATLYIAVGKKIIVGLAVALSVIATSCSSNSEPVVAQVGSETAPTQTHPEVAVAETPHSAAERIKSAVPEVREIVAVTEDNDPNNLIGRPNGYSAAAILMDSRVECSPPDSLGVDCGATIEQWHDQAAAQKRADYIQEMRGNLQFAGAEWTTVKGNLLLRVTGELKPSAADQYEAVFAG